MNEHELLLTIQQLAFAKTETELFLDAHPDHAAALAYYRETVKKLRDVTDRYEAQYGPLTAEHSDGDLWTWIEGPWPWQRCGKNGKDMGK